MMVFGYQGIVLQHGAQGPHWHQASGNMGLEHHALTLFLCNQRPISTSDE